LERLLLLGSGKSGDIVARLSSKGYPLIRLDLDQMRNSHDSVRRCDLVFLCTTRGEGQIIADDIWHLLRNKYVISFAEDLNIRSLRDLYSLSKVARCTLGTEFPAERSLFLISADESLSELDIAAVRRVLHTLGETLLLKEQMLERVTAQLRASAAVLAETIIALGSSTVIDKDVFEYVLGWLLYGMGSAAINGGNISELIPERVRPGSVAGALVKKAVEEIASDLRGSEA